MIGSAVRFRNANKRLSVYDGFNRADSASLGTAPSGQLWTANASFTIASNTLRESGVNGNVATVPFTNPDQLVTFTVADAVRTGTSSIVRGSASGYYIPISDGGGAYRLLKFVAPSTFSTIFSGSGLVTGDRLSLHCKGSTITFLKNRIVVYSGAADPVLLTSSYVGIRSSTTSSPKIFDDFKVYAL